jgi:hypothetical protein
MEQKFYNRVANLLIGTSRGTGALSIMLKVSTPLRITFEITKTEMSVANDATITVNNLRPESRKMIREGMLAILEAGYQDAGGPQTIFHGTIVGASPNLTKPENILTLHVQDGHTALKTARVSLSYRSGTALQQVIKDALRGLGLPLNASFNYTQLPSTILDGPFSYTGNAAVLLDMLCGDNGLQWSVQNGSVKIYNETRTDNLPPQSSVLIGSPRRLFRDMKSVSLENYSGYEFDALLMPKVEPGSAVTIQSADMPKPITLKAAEVKHTGDSYGDKWQTTVKARDV